MDLTHLFSKTVERDASLTQTEHFKRLNSSNLEVFKNIGNALVYTLCRLFFRGEHLNFDRKGHHLNDKCPHFYFVYYLLLIFKSNYLS